MANFTHLHVHTQYSILDGASNVEKLLSRAKELGMDSLAITDHGNMFGVKHFHKAALKAGIKPILGCEAYVARRTRHDKSDKIDRSGYHLILLAKNLVGYKNLTKMVSYSWTEGEYYRPRIDKELLEKYHEGIICCSACLGGEVQQNILNGDIKKAEEAALWYKSLFGEDYYLELQLHITTIPEADQTLAEKQSTSNKALLAISEKYGIKSIATNDIHFINAEDAFAHDHLICLNTGKNLDNTERMRYSGQEYLKSYQEMAQLFPDKPYLLDNTNEIAQKVEVYELNNKPFMPNFPLPKDFKLDIDKLKISYTSSLENAVKGVKDETKREALTKDLVEISISIKSCVTLEDLTSLVDGSNWNKAFDAKNRFPIACQNLYLEHITLIGAAKRYGSPLDENIEKRLRYELGTIEKMGFPGYFLIVWDFIRAAREIDVAVGPGRGSAAGSVVAYCLTITNIDPIKYGLLFERFLNPDRISMPDIDIDFDEDGREKVMKYVVGKYGYKRVAHIITFGRMGAKNSIRDVARVQQLPLQESDRLSKLVPEKPNISLEKAFAEVPELNKERNSENPLIRNTLKYAETLEGSLRQTGVHACGIIIGKDDLENYIPISTNKGAELQVVQYDGHYVEDIGLLKMDFLGLRTLSIIKDAVRNIHLSKNIDIDIEAIPIDDPLTYKLYSNGDTSGIFQFESPGMKKYLRDLGPSCIEDLIAMCALYRPGPMEYIPSFINRKHGLEKITYDLEGMDEYLDVTYGICVYQEQVMLLSQKLAGFTGGQADTLRKAMGKKIMEMLSQLKDIFIKGATERGHDKTTCEKVWSDWESFASYAFNKSHATCYAYVSYQTAYLKAHYPSEFMAAVMSRNFSDISKISFFMDECSRMGTVVNCPDVNESLMVFSVDKNNDIRFGLSAIKGLGAAAAESIIAEREKNGKYKDIFDFIERIDNRVVTKKTIENLILAGAFDSLIDFHRSLFFATAPHQNNSFFENWIKYGIDFKSDMLTSSNSLFSDMEEGNGIIPKPEIPLFEEAWSQMATLSKEKELIGMYVSSHPLDNYDFIIKSRTTCEPSDLQQIDNFKDKNFCTAGIVSLVSEGTTKKGAPYCRMTVEGYKGSYDFAFFGTDYDKFRNYYHPQNKIMIMGRVAARFGTDYRATVNEILSLEEAKERFINSLEIKVAIEDINEELTDTLEEIFSNNEGNVTPTLTICDYNNNVTVNMLVKKYKVEISQSLINNLEKNNFNYKI
ncbi:MAG: DNA polymerase III subunit alpha [Rikenellaceae bacterium]